MILTHIGFKDFNLIWWVCEIEPVIFAADDSAIHMEGDVASDGNGWRQRRLQR